MKLAEALIKVKDIKGKLAEIQRKISSEAIFRKVDPAQEVPSIESDLCDLQTTAAELASFKNRIAKTNAMHGLSTKIYAMDALKFLISTLEAYTTVKQSRVDLEYVGMGERPIPLTTYATYDVAVLTTNIKSSKNNLRALDIELQKLNWEVDLED
jgi:hypothetical protein